MHRPFRALAIVIVTTAALVLPSTASAASPPHSDTAAEVATSDAITGLHIAIEWPEAAAAVDIDIVGNQGARTYTITLNGATPAPSTIGTGCSLVGSVLTCTATDLASFDRGIEVWTTDNSDSVTLAAGGGGGRISAYLRSSSGMNINEFQGGDEDDYVNTFEGATSGANNLYGGAGVDTFDAGTDPMIDDWVVYSDGRLAGVSASLDGNANDGEMVFDGGPENLGLGVDGIIGTHFNDTLTGSVEPEYLFGRDGTDTINGGGGDDYLWGGDGPDTINGGAGSDFVWGDVDTSLGSDNGSTGDDNDTINVAQGGLEVDDVTCNGGVADSVTSDVADQVDADCENGGAPPLTDSDGYISLFTFGAAGTERIIFDPTASSAALDVAVTSNGSTTWTIDYTTGAPVTPHAPECVAAGGAPAGKTRAVCTVTNAEYLRGMEVWLGNGNSTFVPNANILVPFLVHPERGTNDVRGAAGNDTFKGNDFPGQTTPSNTINTFHGMVGADSYIGGPGLDYVSYALHPDSGTLTGTQEFRMTMDGVANDGYLVDGNRGDNVGSTALGIDGIIGSNSRDVITGDAGDNTLYGGAGNDLIDGGAGSDFIKGQADHDHLTGGAGADRTYGDDVTPSTSGSDTLIVNDGVADIANDCGPAEDAITYDAGLDTHINCENLTPPATTTDPTPTNPTPTNPTPTKDTTVPQGWTRGATIPPKTVDYTFPVASWTKPGVTWEGVLLALGFAKPSPPDMKMTAKPLSFNQLPAKWKDDDIAEQQFIGIVIKSGAAPGVANTIRWTENQTIPEVEFQYYDATKGAPVNRSCPASGEVPAQGGGTINLFRYVETLPLNDALYWLNRFGCRVDSKPTLQRVKKLAYAGIANVRSVKVGTQRVVQYTKLVPVEEELRIELAPDYSLQSTDLTLTVKDTGTSTSSLTDNVDEGITAASNTQRLGVHVIEASTGRFVPGARVDLVNEDGKVINSYDTNIAKPTKRGAPIAYADKHMRTNDVGYTRLTFQVGKPGFVWVHAWVENPATGTPVAERWLPVAVHNRGKVAARSLLGIRYESTGASSLIDGHLVPRYTIAKNQGTTKVALTKEGRVKATGVAIIDGILAIFGALDDNSAVVNGAPGVAKAGAEGERILSQEKSAAARLADMAASTSAAKVAVWDGGGSGALVIRNGIVAAGGGNLVAAGGGNLVAAGGGNLVAAGGGNLVGLDGGTLVAAGGGNLVAAGGGNLVAAGGGNLVAAGGGNLVAAGGGNLVAAGGLNKGNQPGVDWIERLRRIARSAADGKGNVFDEIPTNVVWFDEDTSVLVGPSGIVPEGTIVHLQNRGVPVNYPGSL